MQSDIRNEKGLCFLCTEAVKAEPYLIACGLSFFIK